MADTTFTRFREIERAFLKWRNGNQQEPCPVDAGMICDLLARADDLGDRNIELDEQIDRLREQLEEKRSEALVPLRELAESVLPLHLCRQMSDEDLLREVGAALEELAELRRQRV
jgi:hypothetical protein